MSNDHVDENAVHHQRLAVSGGGGGGGASSAYRRFDGNILGILLSGRECSPTSAGGGRLSGGQ